MSNVPKPPSLANVLKVLPRGEPEQPEGPSPLRKIDQPLLKAWPAGYENGSFRLVPGCVLLSAKGKPTLRIEEGVRLDDGIVPPKKSG